MAFGYATREAGRMGDKFLSFVYEQLGPNAGLVVVALTLIALIFPHAVRVWEVWSDIRMGKRAIAAEKTRLEILKARYEIEAIKKEHELAPFPDDVPGQVVPPTAAAGAEPASELQPSAVPRTSNLQPPWRWLRALHHFSPTVAAVTIYVFAAVLGFCTLSLGLVTVFGFFTELSGEAPDWGTVAVMIFLLLTFLFPTLAMLRQGRRLNVFAQANPQSVTEQTVVADS